MDGLKRVAEWVPDVNGAHVAQGLNQGGLRLLSVSWSGGRAVKSGQNGRLLQLDCGALQRGDGFVPGEREGRDKVSASSARSMDDGIKCWVISSFMPAAGEKSKRYITQLCSFLETNTTCRALS